MFEKDASFGQGARGGEGRGQPQIISQLDMGMGTV